MTEIFFDGFFKFLLGATGEIFFLNTCLKIKMKTVLESCLGGEKDNDYQKLKKLKMSVFSSREE
jgi:hypothetical protein